MDANNGTRCSAPGDGTSHNDDKNEYKEKLNQQEEL